MTAPSVPFLRVQVAQLLGENLRPFAWHSHQRHVPLGGSLGAVLHGQLATILYAHLIQLQRVGLAVKILIDSVQFLLQAVQGVPGKWCGIFWMGPSQINARHKIKVEQLLPGNLSCDGSICIAVNKTQCSVLRYLLTLTWHWMIWLSY